MFFKFKFKEPVLRKIVAVGDWKAVSGNYSETS